MVVLVFAHPYPDRSRGNLVLLDAVKDLPGVNVRSLYDLYPDFSIDVEAEQAALKAANIVIWQHPLYWYSVPGLLKHWFDKVLARDWAYGKSMNLKGKHCLWVTTTGASAQAFTQQGIHNHPISAFVPAIEQTARFCGMKWEEPLVAYGAHYIPEMEIQEYADIYRERVRNLIYKQGVLS